MGVTRGHALVGGQPLQPLQTIQPLRAGMRPRAARAQQLTSEEDVLGAGGDHGSAPRASTGSEWLTRRGPVINHGNAGNQTKDTASATISKESGGLPHGKPREAPRKLRKIPRKFREFWWNFGRALQCAELCSRRAW